MFVVGSPPDVSGGLGLTRGCSGITTLTGVLLAVCDGGNCVLGGKVFPLPGANTGGKTLPDGAPGVWITTGNTPTVVRIETFLRVPRLPEGKSGPGSRPGGSG